MDLTDDFRCPISLEIMTDPVILTSGHTFDRASIQRWLDAGNLTCPLTNLTLTPKHSSPILTPNLALRRLIQNSLSTPPLSPHSLPYPSDPQSLSSLLKSIQKSAEFRQKVAESNLVRSLLRHVADPRRPDAQRLAILSILYLSLDGDDVKVSLVAEDAVDSLITAINSNSAAASAAAATAITSLATVDVNKVTIGAHPSAIPSLCAMLLQGSRRKREKKEAATAIYELCKFSENRKRVVRAGVVRSLVTLAGSGLDRAIEILGQLAKLKEGREEMGKDPGFVKVLVGVMRSGTSRGVDSSISVMTLVCGEEKISSEAVKDGILEVLVKLSEGESGKIAKNAVGLLKRLRGEEL